MSLISKIIQPFLKPSKEPVVSEPKLSAESYRFKVLDDKLVPSSKTLLEYYVQQELRFEAQDILRSMQACERLLEDDNSSLDEDDRLGHIRLPHQNFESHPDTGYSYHNDKIGLAGDEIQSHSTKIADNWRGSNHKAVWNKPEQSLEFSFERKAETDYDLPFPSDVVSEGQFRLDSAGQIELPDTASSKERSMAQRASEIIQSSVFWEKIGLSLDGTPADFNPAPEGVVAAALSNDALKGLAQTDALGEAFSWTGEQGKDKLPYQYFDLEKTPTSFLIAGGNAEGTASYGASLSGKRSDTKLSLVLDRPEIGRREKVEWNIAEGIIAYEKSKKG